MADILKTIANKVYQGDEEGVPELVQEALDQDKQPQDIMANGLIAGMDRVGVDFKSGAMYIPEVLLSARAMKGGMAVLRPLMEGKTQFSAGKVVIGTVQGDLHDIGKNLVGMMLSGANFEVIDLGTDVSPAKFLEVVRTEKAQLVGMSALLTTTMVNMKETIDALEDGGVRNQVKIILGGAPVTNEFAHHIGADAYGRDAAMAVDLARQLIAKS
jgi:5-methyltetrahydrofolate--homocysteine methyltransferase